MDPHEWLDREKLIDWMNRGQCAHLSLHRFEYAMIYKALKAWEARMNLNPVAQEVYDHLMLGFEESETPKEYFEYPSEKALKKLQGDL